jgi:hypothetical protein
VCDGLQRAHKQGLVHRDVKPDNILVTREGVAKLTDLGLVKDAETDLNLTKTGRGLGTPHFMAPEQFRNAKGVDIRGDVYSLGATLYAMVTGGVPFNNSNPLDCWMKKIRNEFPAPRELNPALSDRVDWAIRRAMSAEPGQRPASCREFYEDLTGQSRVTGPAAARPAAAADVWYMVYKDETGQSHTVKGATDAIRNALQDGLLGDATTVLVGRTKTGQFQSLHSVPEFRDLVVQPAALPLPGSGRSSGAHPRPGDAGAVDFGAVQTPGPGSSGSITGRSAGSSSGRFAVPPKSPSPGRHVTPPRARTPSLSPPQVSIPTPDASRDPNAETMPFDEPTRTRPPVEEPAARKGFDWMPVMMLVVALISTAVGYYLIAK